jgi:hypothetical protein
MLTEHRLTHIPDLAVGEALLRARFQLGCTPASCRAQCCENGVWLDPAERDRIQAHAELVQSQMDHTQEKNPAAWFDPEQAEDPNFVAGYCLGTQVRNGACVFLNADRRCVLQIADEQVGGTLGLKPFYCAAFPITIVDGVVCHEDYEGALPTSCCQTDPAGKLSALEVCRRELVYVLGEAGFAELLRLAEEQDHTKAEPAGPEDSSR